ncbi:50S ribosomal protein L11 methyltransferase [SAR92 clade bacterium H921]|jgi:ribosomal protein L11 methyltransferase|nr:50S ribosomal protein L11 methyltransferase [SAR92 clade bacterium H921]MDG0972260.1 50S ribosomal protein L11 methyltransferase [Porticoccaceae bacterium]
MQWLQLLIDAPRERSEDFENAIVESGAVSVTLQDGADQPIFAPGVGERPLWDNCIIKALFPATIDTDQVHRQLSVTIQPTPVIRWELLEDKDWSQEWKKYFQPLKCGHRLWICPSWIDPPDPNAINLSLDPGLAFGTGSHPTTHLCLRWLDQQDLLGKTVIDYGCGSGILGIAALLLGAAKVIAIDNDPQALLASRDNAQRNNIADERLITYLPDDIPKGLLVDVMLANILAAPLIHLAPSISNLTSTGGILCLSGLLESQIDDVCAPYLEHFSFQSPTIESDWTQLSGLKIS